MYAQIDSVPNFNLPDEIREYTTYAVASNKVSYYKVIKDIDNSLSQNLINSDGDAIVEDGKIAKYEKWKNFWNTRVDHNGSFKTGNVILYNYLENGSASSSQCSNQNLNWTSLGPSNSIGTLLNKQNQGRLDCVSISPMNVDNVLVGTRNGGIFKTTDGGINWHCTTDDEGYSSYGSVDIAHHPTNPNFVVAATGNELGYGAGVIYSEDAGESWNMLDRLGVDFLMQDDNHFFTDVRIDPRSSDISSGGHVRIYALTVSQLWVYDNFLFQNGGNQGWKLILDDTNWDSNGFTDFEFVNGDLNSFYFTTNSKLYSGNLQWSFPFSSPVTSEILLSNITTNTDPTYTELKALRLATDNNNKLIVAVVLYNPISKIKKIYICTSNHSNNTSWNTFEPTNGFGLESFAVNKVNSQYMYAKNKQANGSEPDFSRSLDGGHNWITISYWNGSNPYSPSMHADIRNINIYNSTSSGNDIVFVVTDGGVQKSIDGQHYVGINGEGLATANFYKGMSVKQLHKQEVLLGAQDGNINYLKDDIWKQLKSNGDNFAALLNPFGFDVFHEISNHIYRRYDLNLSSSSTFNLAFHLNDIDNRFTGFALEMNPINQDRIMIGDDGRNLKKNQDIFYSDNNGIDFIGISEIITDPPYFYTSKGEISAIKMSKSNSKISYYARMGIYYDNRTDGYDDDPIYNVFGFDGIAGGIYKLEETAPGVFVQTVITNNLAIPDNQVAGYNPSVVNLYKNLPLHNSPITDIAIDPLNDLRVWITFAGFKNSAKVWKTENGGTTWQNADPFGSLPNFPVNSIVYQEGTKDRVFIGTDVGVFYKDIYMNDWCRYADMYNLNVSDVDINYCTQTLYASTWNRGLWSAPLEVPPTITKREYIETNETWNSDKIINVSELAIKSGRILTLENMTLYMPKNSRILVGQGAKLVLNNATITNGCGEFWQGIKLIGNNSDHPDINDVISGIYPSSIESIAKLQQGVVLMDNNATIENAEIGINTLRIPYNSSQFYNNGGIILAKSSNFKNNIEAIRINQFNKVKNITTFEDCHFTVDDGFSFEGLHSLAWDGEHTNDIGLKYQFNMERIHGIDILGCKFKDERSNLDHSTNVNTNTIGGISAYDADFTVRSLGNKRARFDNLYRAIRAVKTTSTTMGILRIDECDLLGNRYGMYFKNCNNAIIVKNNIFGVGDIYQHEVGITMEAMSGYTFTENKIRQMGNGMWAREIGTQNGAAVYKNEFKDNEGDGANFVFNNSKLQVSCNDFNKNQAVDLRVIGTSTQQGVLANQGNSNHTSGNTFSVSTPHNLIGLPNTTGVLAKDITVTNSFSYFHSTAVDQTPEWVSPGITLVSVPNPNLQNQCAVLPLSVYDPETGITSSTNQALYENILGDLFATLNCTDNPFLCLYSDAEIKEFALDQLINIYTTDPGIPTQDGAITVNNNIINLLKNNQTGPYRQTQLASYYTLYGEFDKALLKLNEVKNNATIAQEWKDLSDIYLIYNDLEKLSKPWDSISISDLNLLQELSVQETYTKANVVARNVLELITDIRFDEGSIDPFELSQVDSTSTDTVAKFELYPNPVNGILHIGYNKPITEPFTVRIYNLINNEQVYEHNMSAEPFLIDVAEWQNGFYSVVITNTNEEVLFRSKTRIKN